MILSLAYLQVPDQYESTDPPVFHAIPNFCLRHAESLNPVLLKIDPALCPKRQPGESKQPRQVVRSIAQLIPPQILAYIMQSAFPSSTLPLPSMSTLDASLADYGLRNPRSGVEEESLTMLGGYVFYV